MNSSDLQKLREEYSKHVLDEKDVDPDPFGQFKLWMEEALSSQLAEPNAMTLSTVDASGKPHSRVVLLKGFDEEGFLFYTNQASDKGQEISSNPNVSMCFLWLDLERQIRIDGKAEKLPRTEAEEYFKQRPYKSQIGALASDQSKVVPSREFLEKKFEELEEKYPEGQVPMPDNWGGYRVVPEQFEFWQGRRSRLHDRVVYERSENIWNIKRLSP